MEKQMQCGFSSSRDTVLDSVACGFQWDCCNSWTWHWITFLRTRSPCECISIYQLTATKDPWAHPIVHAMLRGEGHHQVASLLASPTTNSCMQNKWGQWGWGADTHIRMRCPMCTRTHICMQGSYLQMCILQIVPSYFTCLKMFTECMTWGKEIWIKLQFEHQVIWYLAVNSQIWGKEERGKPCMKTIWNKMLQSSFCNLLLLRS